MAKKVTSLLLPVAIFVLLTIVLFSPYFFHGLYPIPGDVLIGHYHPWVDKVWQSREAGYPIKNFILFDGIRQVLPWRLLAIEQMKSRTLPLWNPYIFSGTPLLGNCQVAAFYPLNFLFFLLSSFDAWTVYLILQPILGGVLTYFFLRTIACSRKASLLGGISYGFCSIMMNHLEFGIDGHTALWLPLALGAVNKIQQSGKLRWGLTLILAVSMTLLGGYPPPAIYNLIIITAYILFKIRPLISSKTLILIFSLILAFLLTSPQVLPALDLAKRVVREETHFGTLSGEPYFFPFENLIMVVAPDFFGHPATGNWFARIDNSDNPSIGIIGFLLVIYSLFWIVRKREISFWLFWVVFSTLLMTKTPLGQALRDLNLPAFSLVTPMKMIWVVAFSLAVMAGIGMQVVPSLLKKKNFWQFILPIILLWEILFLIWALSFLIPDSSHIRVAQRNLILPTFFLSLSSLLLLFSLFWPRSWPLIASLIILVSGVEMVRQGKKYNSFITEDLIFPSTEILKKIQEDKENWRTMITHQELLPANSNLPYHISMIEGYASVYDGRYGQMVRLASGHPPVKKLESYPRIVFQTEINSSIIDLLNVKYILALEELQEEKLRLIAQEGQTLLYENLKALPKVFFAKKYWREENDLAVANRMLTVDLAQEVVLEKEPDIKLKAESGQAEIIEYQENYLLVKTDKESPGILALTDSFDRGWRADVDGRETEILRANFNLRAVVVPAGKHLIKFIYDPLSFKIGLCLSLGTLFFLVTGGMIVYKTRKEWW